jgi:hypothetical protein
MKYVTAFLLLLLCAGSLFGQSSLPLGTTPNPNSPVGTWSFQTKDRKGYVRVFHADGTITGDGFTGVGKWRVEKGKIMITYPGKGEGWLDLPIKPKGTKAMSHADEPMTAVKIGQ